MAAPAGAWRSKTAAARAAGGPTPAPKPAATKPAAVKPAIEEGSQACDERMLFVASVLIGYRVEVQVKSGVTYEGIFHALRPAGGDFDVLLRMAKPMVPKAAEVADTADWQPVRPTPVLAVEGRELVQITAVDVRMGASDVGATGSAWDDAGGFGTDAAISRARGTWGRERELQRWAPAEGEESAMMQLEESVGPSRGWDQFAVNEAKFGVRTDYAEEFYTTELDPSKSKISMAEAARIAAEIERGDHSTVAANIHMLEERGIAIDDSQMDEEDRYGAVVRDAPPPAPAAGGAANGSAAAASAAPRPNAWAAGRPRPLMPGAPPSAPISIDSRREANKLRMQMTSTGMKQTSPYGTPNAHKRASPLSSPLISDPSKLEALNLNPGVPRLDEQTRREFEQFKAQQAASKGGSGDMFKKQDLQELKQFSQNIESKLSKSLGKESSMPAQPPSAAAAAGDTPAAPPAGPVAAAAAGEAAGEAAPAAAAASAAAAAAAKPPAAEAAAPSAAAGGAEQPAAAAPAEGAKKPSGLNPFAKSFNFNINAKEFKPTFTPGGAASVPPPAASAAAAAPAADAAPAGPVPTAAPGMPSGPGPAGPHGPGFKQGPPSPMRGPMHMPHAHPPSIPMPDMRPDFRRMPRGDGGEGGPGPHPPRMDREGSYGRRRDESRERGLGGGFDRRRDGRHYEGGPGGMRGEGGPPPPPPGKGPGGPQGMQMMMGPMGPMGPMGMQMMPMMPGMPGGGPGQPMAFMVRPMPGQPGMAMQPGMMPMQPGMMPPGAMAGSSPGSRPMMMPQMMMMPPMMMGPGMVPMGMQGMPMPYGGPPGGGGPGGSGGGKPASRDVE